MNTPNLHPGAPGGENRLDRFEQMLRQDVAEPRIDWSLVEAKLMHRVHSASGLGDLASLKADAPADCGLFERVENSLMARIAAHMEYDQPVDDVIAAPAPALEGQWQRMENHLEDRIRSVQGFSPWEQMLKASEQPAPAFYERIEDRLEERMLATPADDWEKLVAAEEPNLTLGRLDSVEQSLFTRIAATEKNALLIPAGFALQFAWLWKSPVGRMALTVLFMAGLGFSGYRYLENRSGTLPTLVYQTQGSMAQPGGILPAGSPVSIENAPVIASGSGGAVTVVNSRGFVELRNGAALRLEKASKREVRYRYVPPSGQLALGKATFFVNKRQGKERFEVTTPDYRIEVTGTYFQVNPDLNGRVATTVLEGKVRIVSLEIGDVSLSQGQSLVYDETSRKYLVRNGGPVVDREAIDKLPAMQDLHDHEVLTLASSIPQAEVTLDGRYRGVTPLAILQTPGEHTLRLVKDGFVALDTVITVAKGSGSSLWIQLQPLASAMASLPVRPETRALAPRLPGLPMASVSPSRLDTPATPVTDAEILFRQAEAMQDKDWAMAIRLYEKLLGQIGPGIRREAALFAIARLRADHDSRGAGKSQARQDFLDYLARFPQGTFAGESWLRLAELELEINPDKAVEYYLKVFERYPRHHRLAELQHRVGLIYLQEGKYDSAVDMFKQGLSNILLDNESEKRKLLTGLHRALVAKGDAKAAERVEKDMLSTR